MVIYLQIIKTALAAAVSWLVVTTWLHWPYPYFAPLAAILTVQATISESVKKAWQRLLGTIGGVVVSAIISQWMGLGAATIFIAIVTGMAISALLRLPPYISSQAAVSSLMVLAFSQSPGYGLNRVTETIIGSVIGVLSNTFIFPPNSIAKAERHILTLSAQAARTLKNLGAAIESKDVDACSPLVDVTELEQATLKSLNSIKLAQESLVFNPLLAKKCRRLLELTTGMRHLEHVSIQIRGVRRGFIALADNFPQNLELDKLKAALDFTADCIEEFGANLITHSEYSAKRLESSLNRAVYYQNGCLTALIKVDSLSLTREIGAILTDLHRILEEITPANS